MRALGEGKVVGNLVASLVVARRVNGARLPIGENAAKTDCGSVSIHRCGGTVYAPLIPKLIHLVVANQHVPGGDNETILRVRSPPASGRGNQRRLVPAPDIRHRTDVI